MTLNFTLTNGLIAAVDTATCLVRRTMTAVFGAMNNDVRRAVRGAASTMNKDLAKGQLDPSKIQIVEHDVGTIVYYDNQLALRIGDPLQLVPPTHEPIVVDRVTKKLARLRSRKTLNDYLSDLVDTYGWDFRRDKFKALSKESSEAIQKEIAIARLRMNK